MRDLKFRETRGWVGFLSHGGEQVLGAGKCCSNLLIPNIGILFLVNHIYRVKKNHPNLVPRSHWNVSLSGMNSSAFLSQFWGGSWGDGAWFINSLVLLQNNVLLLLKHWFIISQNHEYFPPKSLWCRALSLTPVLFPHFIPWDGWTLWGFLPPGSFPQIFPCFPEFFPLIFHSFLPAVQGKDHGWVPLPGISWWLPNLETPGFQPKAGSSGNIPGSSSGSLILSPIIPGLFSECVICVYYTWSLNHVQTSTSSSPGALKSISTSHSPPVITAWSQLLE